jgi:hypothetical protein
MSGVSNKYENSIENHLIDSKLFPVDSCFGGLTIYKLVF